MAAPTFVLSETNGAGTVTDGIGTITFASVDQNSNVANLATTYPVTVPSTGTAYSFEKYNRLKVTGAASNSLSAFGVYFSATAPTDSSGVTTFITPNFGATPTYAAPVNTVSTVATSACSATTAAPGTALVAPTNAIGSYSSFFVQQLAIGSGAIGGNTIWPATWWTIQYSYS
jgi:hypothetical protein